MSAVQKAVEVVARHTGVPGRQIISRNVRRRLMRDADGKVLGGRRYPPEVRFARQVAAYLTVVIAEVPIRRLAREIGWHADTIRRAVREVEDGRDDPALDARIEALERELVA